MGVTVKNRRDKRADEKGSGFKGNYGGIRGIHDLRLSGIRAGGAQDPWPVKIPDGGCRPFQEKRRDEAVKTEGLLCQVDGNGELGHIAALYSTNLAIAAAKEHGVGITALKNVGR